MEGRRSRDLLLTDESTPLYFEYELSPLNYELPIIVPNFGGDFFGWRPWHYENERKTRHATKVIKDDKGNVTSWVGEFFIPYTLLKPLQNVPPKSGTTWRVNLYRNDYDEGQSSWSWQPVQTNFHDFSVSVRFDLNNGRYDEDVDNIFFPQKSLINAH